MLAHGSCISREYGIPAIQINNAMSYIPDGATIDVNADTGEVRILTAPPDDSPPTDDEAGEIPRAEASTAEATPKDPAEPEKPRHSPDPDGTAVAPEPATAHA